MSSRPSTNSNGWPKAFSLTEASAGGRGRMVWEPAPGPQASASRLGAPRDPSSSSSSTARAPGAAAAAAAAPPVAALSPQAGSAAAARHQALVIIGALLHLLLAVHQWRSQESGRLHAVALALATAALAAANVRFAGFCLRHRTAILTVSRLAVFLSPAWREVLPPLLLDRAAQPGLLGFVRDTAHVLTGTRLLLVAVGGAAVPLPPAATVAVQLLLLHLSSPAPLCCAAQLLANNLSRHRLARLAATADCITLPAQLLVVMADPSALPGPASVPQPAAACTAVLLFAQLSLGLLLPVLLAAYTWQPVAAADGDTGILAMPRVAHLQHLAAPHIAFLRTLRNSIASWLSKGTMGADAAVHALLGSSTGLSSRAAAAYWVLSLCWLLCKRLAGIYAIC